MRSFAIIAEGLTDQVFLETILTAWYGNETIYVNHIQPIRDATDRSRQGDFGGWEQVLEYCTYADQISASLAVNDYLIIQIDTDVCEHVNFGVSLTTGGLDRDEGGLIVDVVAVLEAKLGATICHDFGHRIFYAVPVHSLECWLLLAHDEQRSRTKSCEDHLRATLKRTGATYEKTARCYSALSAPFRKIKTVNSCAQRSYSLNAFLGKLPK